MEFVNRLRAMPLWRQIVLVIGILVIAGLVASAGYFVILKQPESVLFSNLRTLDAATIVSELDKRKVRYHLKDGGTTILVPSNVVDATRLAILSENLPLKGTVGFELFNKSDIGLTEFEQRINYQRALQGELARTIMAFDEIDAARVHLSLPEPTIFRDDKRAPKASIALTLKPGRQLSARNVAGIQKLVAAAVSDMDAANVVVVDGEGQVVSSDAASQAAASPQQRTVENFYVAKIRRALVATYPDQEFTVKVLAVPILDGIGIADPASADETDQAHQDPFLSWTPEQRNFSLTVEVITAAARDPEIQKNVRLATEAAIIDDPSLGDDVSVSALEPALLSATEASTAAKTASHASTSVKSPMGGTASLPAYAFWVAIMVIALIGLTLSGGRLLRLGKRARKLSEVERRAFANRFQSLLDQGEGDAADSF